MKNLIFMLGLIFLGFNNLLAQQDTTTIFQRPAGYFNDPVRSKLKMKVEEQHGLWVLSLYHRKYGLQEQISFVDKELSVRKGPYLLLEKGNIVEEGVYEKGYKIGEWKKHYPNHVLAESAHYVWGKLNGELKSYWENGNLKAIKRYNKDKRRGDWKLFYQNGKLALAETYQENGKLSTGIYFDTLGKSIDKKAIDFN